MMHPRAERLIELLNLEPHPEGGYFGELYRSELTVLPTDGRQSRAALSSIYFMLIEGIHDRWHRVRSDEAWHYYEGAPLELTWVEADLTTCTRHRLGPVEEDQSPVCVVPAHCWQAAQTTGTYSLVGCTVGPGFDYEDFEILRAQPGEAAAFRREFPKLARLL